MRERSGLWHRSCLEKSCQVSDYLQKFIGLIPTKIDPSHRKTNSDFTRDRKLPFRRLITFILSITASGKGKGVDTKSGEFFKNARRAGLWPDAEPIHRSAFSRARNKVNWTVFRDILSKAVRVAYDCWPKDPKYLWRGMSVYAFDGSKYSLPATDEIRKEFDPQSGLQYSGKGHYPQCLVSTVYDIFRRLPVARVIGGTDASERDQAKQLLPFVPPRSVCLYDRGYPSYEFIKHLITSFFGYFVFRCPASSTFPAVEKFVKSRKKETVIWLDPSNKYLRHISARQRKKLKPIKLRVIRLVSPDGTVSVLLTNLFDKQQFPRSEIIGLYFRRWGIEGYYRDEKTVLEIEKFHGRTPNSIRQELFAAVIMSVISRTLMALSGHVFAPTARESQFKNAVMTLASEAAVLVPDFPDKAAAIFNEIIQEISRVKYYRPKIHRPSQPRVTKRNINKWATARLRKLANA